MSNGAVWISEIVCQNEACADYGKPNVRRFGKTRSGVQRYQCKQCRRTFTQTKGTLFYNLHTSPEIVLDCLARLARGSCAADVCAQQGLKEETLRAWLRAATEHVADVEQMLRQTHRLKRSHFDTLWAQAK